MHTAALNVNAPKIVINISVILSMNRSREKSKNCKILFLHAHTCAEVHYKSLKVNSSNMHFHFSNNFASLLNVLITLNDMKHFSS